MLMQPRTFLSRILLTEDQSRLRAGWRLLIAVILTGLFFQTVDLIRSALSMKGPTTAIIGSLIDFAVVTGAIYLARRFADKRSFASLGLQINKHAVFDIIVGVVLAFVLMLLIYLIEYTLGWLIFESFAWQVEASSSVITYILRYFVVLLFVGWNEELVYRGYILQTLASGLNPIWALLLSSLYFGIEHLSNPNSSWMAVGGIFLIGLFFAYGYLRTGQLWLPIGIHIGWNFFENGVFGFPVSGFDRPGLFRVTVSGPDFWTGGAFGPEAGLIILPICLLGAVLVYMYTAHRKIM
jgi:membrane protease YdiL (CAAX protease family)